MARSGNLFRLATRFLRARRLRSALAVVSVVLGVGLLSALLTLNRTMEVSVEAYLTKVYGNFDIMVGYRKPNTRLSEADVAFIGQQPGVEGAAGVLIPYMYESHPELAEQRLNYYGATNSALGRQFMPLKEGQFPGPGQVAISEAWAKKTGVTIGDTLDLPFPPNGKKQVTISGFLPTISEMSVGTAIFDRAWLGAATSRPGSTFTLVMVQKNVDINLITNAVRSRFPDLEVDQRKYRDEARKNLNAMRPVALGMGIAALLAAGFLLAGAFRMSLAERIHELAMLRAIGAVPRQVSRMVLVEGLILGGVGSALGALLGAGAAAAVAGAIARLMETEPVPAVIPWGWTGVTALGGTVFSVLSAVGVARAAGRTEPLRAMRPDLPAEEQEARRGGRLGLIVLVLGIGTLLVKPLLPPEADGLKALVSSTGGLCVTVGLLLGLQRFLPPLLQVFAFPLRKTVEGPVAVRSLIKHRRRSSLTVGATSLGLVLVVASSTMASSLLGTWQRQVKEEHPADFQLEVPHLMEQGVSEELAKRVAAITGVTSVAAVGEGVQVLITDWDWTRASQEYMQASERWNTRYWKGYESLDVQWADLPSLTKMGAYHVLEGSLDHWGETSIAFTKGRAEQLGVKAGDRLELNVSQAAMGERVSNPQAVTYTVVAILDNTSYTFPWVIVGKPVAGSKGTLMALYGMAEPARKDEVRHQVRALTQTMEYSIAEYSDFETAAAKLRAQVNQRFALLMTVVVVMAIVMIMSLTNTMIGSVSERRREFAMLRCIGATPVQVNRLVILEAVLLGLVGGLIGVAGGVVLGTSALTGLDLPLAQVSLPWEVMGLGLLGSVGIACVAALAPVRKVATLSPTEAVRI